MKKIVAIILFLILAFTGQPGQPAIMAEEMPPATLPPATTLPFFSLQSFLTDTEMTLEQYIERMAEFAEAGEISFFIEKNALRYKVYEAVYPDMPYERVLAFVNVNLDYGFYREIVEAPDLDEISMLINKTYSLPSTWEPDLINIGTGHLMHSAASEFINLMRAAAADAGFRVHIVSTYRSYASQANTFNRALSYRNRESVETNFARPGHSEHQTGLTVDLLHRSHSGYMSDARFHQTDLYKWLLENAHQYGFILRYPAEYVEFHGYIFEPWHWRFVGVDIATAMFNLDIVLYEDFYGRYIASDVLHRAHELINEQQLMIEAAEAEAHALVLAEAEEAERLAILEEENRQAELRANRQSLYEAVMQGYNPTDASESDVISPVHYGLYIGGALLLVVYICATIIFIIIPKIRENTKGKENENKTTDSML